MKASEFINRFEQFCPPSLAEPGDPVGLQIGSLAGDIKKILVSLDVRPEVVAEAIAQKVDLILVKHPPIFRPVASITDASPQTKMYLDLIQHQIAVYCAHTNMDIIENGLNDWFCERLGITVSGYMEKTHTIPYHKMQLFAPTRSVPLLRAELAKIGVGKIGAYTGCSFESTGVGHFTPSSEAHPTIGKREVAEDVAETKLEFIYEAPLEVAVLAQIKKFHPYEEPVYDIFLDLAKEKTYGLGRVGMLAAPVSLEALTQHVKRVFHLDGLRLITHEPKKMVQKIAICGGSAAKFYPSALQAGADCYITGDVDYHTGHDMIASGLSVIDPGHYIEILCVEKLSALFTQWQQENAWDVEIIASKVNTTPFTFK